MNKQQQNISIKSYEQALDERVSLSGIKWVKKWDVCIQCDSREEAEALRAALAQPEPVAVWELEEDGWDTIADPEWMETLPVGTKLYTAPPQRKPLSDEQIGRDFYGCTIFVRKVEAAHGIEAAS